MTVFRRFATVAVAGVIFAAAAAAQEKKDKADSQVPTADLTPVWVVMDHAMDATGGIQSGYGTSTYDVSSGATATDLKVEPVAAEDSPTIEFRNDVIKGQEGKVYVPFQLLINRDKVTTKTLVISTRMKPPELARRSGLGGRLEAGHVIALDDPLSMRRFTEEEIEYWRDWGLYYFVPCVAKEGTIAVLALGRNESAEPLSSEDMSRHRYSAPPRISVP